MSQKVDALVAEHIIGWKHAKHSYAEEIAKGRKLGTSGRPVKVSVYYAGTLDGVIPSYSTDIAAAWEVVEKLRSEDWEPAIDGLVRTWEALFDRGEDRGIAEHQSAPMAICLAALRTKGIEITDE